jgi:hypothetical protein
MADSENRLNDLKKATGLLGKVSKAREISASEAMGLMKVLSDFSSALDILNQYDHQLLKIPKSKTKEVFHIS